MNEDAKKLFFAVLVRMTAIVSLYALLSLVPTLSTTLTFICVSCLTMMSYMTIKIPDQTIGKYKKSLNLFTIFTMLVLLNSKHPLIDLLPMKYLQDSNNWPMILLGILFVILIVMFVTQKDLRNSDSNKIVSVQRSDENYNKNVRIDSSKREILYTTVIVLIVFLAIVSIFNNFMNVDISKYNLDRFWDLSLIIFIVLLFIAGLIYVVLTIIRGYKNKPKNSDVEVTNNINNVNAVVSSLGALVFTSYMLRKGNVSIDKLFNDVTDPNWWVIPLYLIISFLSFALVYMLLYAFISIVRHQKNVSDLKEALKKAFDKVDHGKFHEIISGSINFVISSLYNIVSFLLFIPDFFTSLKDTIEEPKDVDKTNKILKIAAFCFSIISWIATAKGLEIYVFKESAWQAIFVSFAIQAILFIFNLKLPEYYHQVGKSRKLHKFIMVSFYLALLSSSSFFSYIYIVDSVYKDTELVDANSNLTINYSSTLSELDKYCKEETEVLQIKLSEYLSKMYEQIDSNAKGDNSKDKGSNSNDKLRLESDVKKAENEVNSLKNQLAVSQKKYNDTLNYYNSIQADPYASTYDKSTAIYNLDLAYQDVQNLQTKLVESQNALEDAKNKLKNYQPNIHMIIRSLLTESKKTKLNIATINELIKQYEDLCLNEEDLTGDMVELNRNGQELKILIQSLSEINKVQFGAKDSTLRGIVKLKDEFVNNRLSITAQSKEEDVLKWKNEWKKRYSELETHIQTLPLKYNVTEVDLKNYSTVNFQLINKFNPDKTAENMVKISRRYVENVNVLEKGFNYLFYNAHKYLAMFSLIFALLLDLFSLGIGVFIYKRSTKEQNEAVKETQ